MIDVVML